MKSPAPKAPDNPQQAAAVSPLHKGSSKATAQFNDQRPETVAQRKLQQSASKSTQVRQLQAFQERVNAACLPPPAEADDKVSTQRKVQAEGPSTRPLQRPANHTGMPDQLKTGIEQLSGIAMDHVRVHYNSPKPATLQAHAYAQGSHIHLAPGQEQHLPHEAWHVVQQAQGRVRPTTQLRSKVPVNDDRRLEREADVMGAKAMQLRSHAKAPRRQGLPTPQAPIQLKSMVAVKQELRGGGILSNFAAAFINSHIGLGANTNVSACKVHAARAAPPLTNTVVMDPRALKTGLEAGVWVNAPNHWTVSTNAGNIALQDTVRLNAVIDPAPAGAVAFARTGLGDDAQNFTVQNQTITAIVGATDAEVLAAVQAQRDAYPHNKDSNKKRAYRQRLVEDIKQQRTNAANDATVTWIKANFASIGGTAMNGNAAITTIAHVNAVASRQVNVEVFIGKDSGNVFHFEREF